MAFAERVTHKALGVDLHADEASDLGKFFRIQRWRSRVEQPVALHGHHFAQTTPNAKPGGLARASQA